MRHTPLSRFIILFIPWLENWLKKLLETDSKSGRKSADSKKLPRAHPRSLSFTAFYCRVFKN